MALIGLGRMGKIHLGHLLHSIKDVTVVAVADAFCERDAFEKEYGSVFFSNDSAEAMDRADAVVICTPTSSHAMLVEAAIKKGRHIFCEKPLDLSLELTIELLEKATDAGVKLMLGFNRRFDPDFMQARKSISDGKIGSVQIVKITNRDPGIPPVEFLKTSGGMFMDFSIHDFDIARFLMGKEVTEVFARGLVFMDKSVEEAGDIDTALITLTFEDGSYAVIDNSRKAVYGYDQRLEIFGSGGMIQVENNLYHRNVVYDENGIHHSLPLNSFTERYITSYLNEMSLFVQAVTTGKEVPLSAGDIVKATQMAYAASRSMQQGAPIKLTSPLPIKQ